MGMGIYRVTSGLIFDDDFRTLDTERWVISPSNSYSLLGNGLTLRHSAVGETSAMFEFPEGEEELLFEVEASYTPERVGDEGGLVVWKSAMEKLEFLESEDSTADTEFTSWRVTKRGNLFTFFAEREGAWELFDSSVCVNPVRAGIVLKGENDLGYVPLLVRRAILCRGTHITVGNVSNGFTVILMDEEGNEVYRQAVPDGYSGIKINLPSIPYLGRIRAIDSESNIIHDTEEPVSMYGGDVFLVGTELRVKWRGKELNQFSPTLIGALKNGELIEKMTLFNPTKLHIAENIRIKIAQFQDSFGWEWAEVAEDDNGKPKEFKKEIPMGNLNPSEERDFWVRLRRTTNDVSTQPTLFLLDIRND